MTKSTNVVSNQGDNNKNFQVELDPLNDPDKINGIEHQALLFPQEQENPARLKRIKIEMGKMSDANVIGEGGYGIFYYGVLEDNTQVAVKNLPNNRNRLRRNLKLKWKQFAVFSTSVWLDCWDIVLKELIAVFLLNMQAEACMLNKEVMCTA
ncbi:hypothetical protein Ancab_003800 [Ancistrocladus abbreviatus]